MQRVLSNIFCDLDLKAKCQIMYFLINASPPKPLDVATLQVHRSHDVEGTLATFHVTLTSRSKVK